MSMRINAGYIITDSVHIGESEFVLGVNMNEPSQFVTFVSSHLLSEIELMADNIGILNHGRLLFEGTLDTLKSGAASQGYPTDNLEDTFLALIDADNRQRGGVR